MLRSLAIEFSPPGYYIGPAGGGYSGIYIVFFSCFKPYNLHIFHSGHSDASNSFLRHVNGVVLCGVFSSAVPCQVYSTSVGDVCCCRWGLLQVCGGLSLRKDAAVFNNTWLPLRRQGGSLILRKQLCRMLSSGLVIEQAEAVFQAQHPAAGIVCVLRDKAFFYRQQYIFAGSGVVRLHYHIDTCIYA